MRYRGPTHRVQVVTRVTKTKIGDPVVIIGGEGDLQGHLDYHRNCVLRSLGRGRFGTLAEVRLIKAEGFDVVEAE